MQTQKVFKRTYLHIGLGKTGSSAIQKQLYKYADVLEREHDIHFPHTLNEAERFDGNHSKYLGAMFADEAGPSHSQIVAGFGSAEELAIFAEKLRAQFEKGFAVSKAQQLLISAEGLGHFSRPRLLRFSEWLAQFSDEIEIIACVRHPLDALSSEIQQMLKLGYVLEDLYEKPPYYRFTRLFDRVERAFPNSKFHIYDFSTAVVDPRGLAGVFLNSIGVDIDLPAPSAQFANASMSHEAALLLSALNRTRPIVVEGGRSKFRSPNDVVEIGNIPGRKYQAPREVYERVSMLVADELTWLKAQHGIELQARSALPDLDYKHFSDESINEIALRMATLSKTRYAVSAPFRFLRGYLRIIWSNILRKGR